MCIILGKLQGNKHFTKQEIKNCISNNGDGSSYTIFNEKMELIKTYKTLDNDEFLKKYDELKKLPKEYTIIYHFRIATNGAICENNCHPFENKNNILWHNGIFLEFSSDKTKSDTRQFLNKYITSKNIDFKTIEKQASTSNKIVVYNKASKKLYYSKNFKKLENGNIASNDTYSYNYNDYLSKYCYNSDLAMYPNDDLYYFDSMSMNRELNKSIDNIVAQLKGVKYYDDIYEKIDELENISNYILNLIYTI